MSGENGATEIFTDEKGYACSIPLPFGSYIVRETTTPHNYKPVDDFEVNITEHHPNEPQIWRVLLDEMCIRDRYYTQLEANLQERINNMESEEPGHEEYRYNIGPIEHDPFILISYLSAK